MAKMSLSLLNIHRSNIKLDALAMHQPPSRPSNEALSVHHTVSNTVQKLSKFMTNIADSVEIGTLQWVDIFTGTDKAEVREIQIVERDLTKINYMDLGPQRFPVVMGLDTTWLKFLKNIEVDVDICARLYDDFLEPFKRFVALGISNPDEFSSDIITKKINSFDFDTALKNLGKDLNGNVRIPNRRWDKLVDRNADFNEVVTQTQTLMKTFELSNPDLIKRTTEEITGLLQELSKMIVDPNNQYRLTKNSIVQLSEMAYQLAKSVEFYGVIYKTVLAHAQAMKETVTKLRKII